MAAGKRRPRANKRPGPRTPHGGAAKDPAARSIPDKVVPGAPVEIADPDAPVLARADLGFAVAVGAIAACVFATTFSGHVALGDAPETVAGVKTLGVLHSPGYPAYVLAAHAFGDVIPVGSWALRVNLFSVVCSALMVAAMFLLARGFGASRAGAAIGTLAVAASASFWFNAGFAKHYGFTGMLAAAGAMFVMLWVRLDRGWFLLAAAIALGLCIGSGWEIALIVVLSAMVLFWAGTRRPSRVLAISSVLVMGGLAIAGYVFLVVRAGQHPAVSWGEATNPSRLFALLTDRDFQKAGVAPSSSNLVIRIPVRVGSYGGIIARDLGLGAAALVIAGVVYAWKRLERGPKLFLAALAVLNLVSVATAITFIDHIMGFRTSVIAGGYLLDLMIVLAVLISIAFTPLTQAVSKVIAEWTTDRRFAAQAAGRAHALSPVVAAVIAALVLVPSLAFHYLPANHRTAPLAHRYGSRVLADLPPKSVLFILPADWAFPPIYRQVVDGQRPDVSVVSIDSISLSWYLLQLERELAMPLPDAKTPLDRAVALIAALRSAGRPVYLDTSAMQLLQQTVGYRAQGLVAEVVSGKGPQPIADRAAAAAELQTIDREDGVTDDRYLRFPNDPVLFFHQRGHIELAKAHLLAHDTPAALDELQRAVDIYPDDEKTAAVLLFMRQRGTGVEDIILHM
jgi:hypothetical protein